MLEVCKRASKRKCVTQYTILKTAASEAPGGTATNRANYKGQSAHVSRSISLSSSCALIEAPCEKLRHLNGASIRRGAPPEEGQIRRWLIAIQAA